MKTNKDRLLESYNMRCLDCGHKGRNEISGYIGRCPNCASYNVKIRTNYVKPMKTNSDWAIRFHKLYEKSAHKFGYVSRLETREFDANSPNGKLMTYVCNKIIQEAQQSLKDKILDEIEYERWECRHTKEQSLENIKKTIESI